MWYVLIVSVLAGVTALAIATRQAMRDFPDDLESLVGIAVKSQVLARDGTPLSYTLENSWNATDVVPLARIPALLQTAFVVAEDQHFYQHHGVDWPARCAALFLDIREGSAIRGASSITEQVVRMVHPRPRNLWSRWIEGFEAARLDARLSKAQILSFYLNQVPYADRRRGIVQASRLYFNRGLDTLSAGEQLSLAVLVRSPVGMDLRRNAQRARWAAEQLADRMRQRGELTAGQREQIRADPWVLNDSQGSVEASHFVSHAMSLPRSGPVRAQIHTTLDPHIQVTAQKILEGALTGLARRHVHDGALIVIDHQHNEILGWVVGRGKGGHGAAGSPGLGYDTVLTRRQPGSTMKPLLYALALERGWTAATLIDDSELSEAVGAGQHTFHNYSHRSYGLLRLREALGNSLNIPAVETLKFVGEDAFMERLHELGISSLTRNPQFYGDGLALGNGEISLYEMAQAYTVLARGGRFEPLTLLANDEVSPRPDVSVFSPAVATLIGDILADPDARMLEFGRGLQFPVQTAIKTGTSTDYRDAWAIAYDYQHTVAVWMGNLDGSAMDGVTGAVGPAMVLRSMFSELNRGQDTRPLALSRDLILARICRRDGLLADDVCESTNEWFLPGTVPPPRTGASAEPAPARYRMLQPTAGLLVAHDPRIPAEFEALPMQIAPVPGLHRVDWYVDGKLASSTPRPSYPWPLQRGTHSVHAKVWAQTSSDAHDTEEIRFYVN
ncbi:MAG: glycosyl transferase [Gammaproteobacteria bacterium]|nr:glycosyl transferase [Gammaproteobacteria bacterium]